MLLQPKNILESLLFITDKPLSVKELEELIGEEHAALVPSLLEEIKADYETRGGALHLREVAGGAQLATRPEFAPWIRNLYKDKTTFHLSGSAMETLSIIAYKQPITRSEIEEIRGVETTAVLESLIEKKLIRNVGRKETIGRPLLYGTTFEFMKYFGIKNLEDLPPLGQTPVEESAAPEAAPAPAEGNNP